MSVTPIPPTDRTLLDLLLLRSLEGRADAAFREGHEIGAMVALLVADVAAETATRLALAHIEKRVSSDKIHDLLGTLSAEKVPLKIHEEPIKQLRKARNPVQHGGSVPAASVVALHIKAMHAFLADVANVVFGVELDAITAVDFVGDSEIRNALSAAVTALDVGDLAAAIANAAAAFETYRIVWGQWTRRALGVTWEDEWGHGRTVSPAAAAISVHRALEPILADGSWQSAANATIGLPVPLLARWRRVVRMAERGYDGDMHLIEAEELRALIDRLALVIWSTESSHPGLLDDHESGTE